MAEPVGIAISECLEFKGAGEDEKSKIDNGSADVTHVALLASGSSSNMYHHD